jgi:hypothetical protein
LVGAQKLVEHTLEGRMLTAPKHRVADQLEAPVGFSKERQHRFGAADVASQDHGSGHFTPRRLLFADGFNVRS